jgi:LPS-assembly protein
MIAGCPSPGPSMRPLSAILHLLACAATTSAMAVSCRVPPQPAAGGSLAAAASAAEAVVPAVDAAPDAPAPESNAPAPAPAAAVAQPAAPAGADDAAIADWVPREQMTPAQADATAPYCSGAYLEPEVIAGRTDGLINADSQSAEYLIGGNVSLIGDVVFSYRNSRMSTQRATFEADTQRVQLEGQVLYRQPGLLIQGENATMVLEPQTASVDNASFVLHGGGTRGRAERVEQSADGTLSIRDGLITRCEPGDGTWTLSTGSVEIDPRRQFATARNAVLRIEDVPVAYVPYLKFPVNDERASGFLFPSVGRSGESGFDASIPYYWNLAPNYDATLTPRYLSDRGVLLEAEGRYRTEGSENVLGLAYLPEDDNYNGRVNRQEFNELGSVGKFRPDKRWLLTFSNRGDYGDFTSFIDYTAVSDLDYFVDLGTDLSIASKSQLERRGMLGYAKDGFRARISALRVQPLQFEIVEPYQRLPEVALGYQGRLSGLPLNYRIDGEWSRFDRATDALAGVDQFTGSRFHVEPRLTVPLRRAWGHLDGTVAYRYTRYDLQARDAALDEQPERGVALASLDGGLVFERNTAIFGNDVKQTLEPRIFYLWSQRDGQDELPLFDSSRLTFDYAQLFRENRFTGRDRIADANQLSLAVTTRYLDARTGVERVRASFGRIVNFTQQRVDVDPRNDDERGNSPWAGEVSAEVLPGLGIRGSWVWDGRDRVEDSGRVELHYQPKQRFDGDQRILHVGYSRQGSAIRQSDVSAYWPMSKRLRLIGRWYYDIDDGRTLEAFGGIELDACCYRVRVVARRYLRNSIDSTSSEAERGIFFQFVLKGLAGFGGGVDRILENGIPGYREDSYDLQ